MGLVQRDTDKKAARIGYLVSIAIFAIIGAVFWQSDMGQAMIKNIMEVTEGDAPQKRKMAKPKIKKLKMIAPKSIKPKFKVDTKLPTTQFDIDMQSFSGMDDGVAIGNFSGMAQNIQGFAFNVDNNIVANVMDDMMGDIGVLDDFSTKTKVRGRGNRMRAKLNLCQVATPGSSQDPTGKKVEWDYIYRENQSIARVRSWLKENTKIQVTENTLTIDYRYTYKEWVQKIQNGGAKEIDSTSYYFAEMGLSYLSNAIEEMEVNEISGKKGFVELIKRAALKYIERKYYIDSIAFLDNNALIKKVEEDNPLLRSWRLNGIKELLAISSSLNSESSKTSLINAIKPMYIHFRKSRILENPLTLIANVVGLEKIAEENLDILRHYVTNGGFLWVDETGHSSQFIKNQDKLAKGFVFSLMSPFQKKTLSKKEKSTWKTLIKDDNDVPGFKLAGSFPEPGHPYIYIKLRVPSDVEASVKIFNGQGRLVWNQDWTRKRPLKAGSYTSKESALRWDCVNSKNEPVESALYFIQFQSGLYQKTHQVHVSKLRKLDEKHPLFSVVHNFTNVPVCKISNVSETWVNRPYGNSAFGYYYKGRMALLYTEGAGVIAGLGALDNPVVRKQSSKFLNNVIAFCLQDENGVALKP